MRRSILALTLLSVIGFAAAVFFEYTTVDEPIRVRLQPALSQSLQERLRPLRAPEVLRFSPRWEAEDVGPRAPVTISFLTEMDRPTTEANIHIGPSVPGSFKWHDKTVTFTPIEPWPLDTEVTVRVDRGARSRLYRRMIEPFQWTFRTLGPPRVVETEPAQEARYAYTGNNIAIRFSRLMDRASVESRLRIQPEPFNMALEWQGEQLLIGGALRPSTQYTVSLLKGAQDAVYGLETEEDLSWSFTTTQRYPYLAIVGTGRFASVRADEPAELMLNMVNISQIDFALYRIDLSTYVQVAGFRYGDWLRFEPGTEPLRTWTVKPDAPTDEDVQRPLQIDPLESGLYLLTAEAPEAPVEGQVLIAGQTALTLKRSPTQILAWATSMDDGAPVAGLSLQAYNNDGELLAEGQTDGDGLWFSRFPGSAEPVHVIGAADGDFAAASDVWQTGIEPWQFEGVQWQRDFRPREHRVFLYADRPIYRPGQTVHFRGVVRRDRDGQYELPPAGTPVQVKVANWNGDVLYEQILETTPFGSVYGSFELSDEVGLGQWRLLAQIDGEEYETNFQIEEYRKPEYSVDVRFGVGARQVGPMVHEQSDLLSDLPRPYYINGDTLQATVNARYFFGAPAAGAQVRWTLYANDYYFPFPDESFRDFAAEPLYYGYGREIARGEGLADDSGTFTLSQPADISSEDRSQVFTLEAQVTDPASQPVSGVATVLVHRGEFYIGVRPENYVVNTGSSTSFKVRTVDVDGNPVAQNLTYTIEHVAWERRGARDGFYEWGEVRTPVTQGTVSTDALGDSIIAFSPDVGGSYQIRVQGTDGKGNRVLGFGWLWVSEPGRLIGWRFDNNDRIDLVADARTYQIGDTARVLVQSPYEAATALVTVERAGILHYRVVELNTNSATIEVPVEERFFPNVYVSTVLIPRDGSPSFKVGYVELRVQSEKHRINVAVEANRDEYRPGDEASYAIRTTDIDGNPVPAEVSVGVVDAAVFSLTGAGTPDIVEGLYGRQPLAVRTAGSLAVLSSRRNRPENFGGGGGPGEEGVRRLFPDVAYWNPTVMTGEDGKAEVSFKLPDNLTTWRAMALGVTAGTRVGQAQEDVVVTKDLIIRPVLPRFFRVGDQASIGAIVQNFTGRPQSVDVSLSTTNLGFPSDLRTRSFVIGQGQAVRVDWPVTVPEACPEPCRRATDAVITMRAVAPEGSDAVETTLPIEPFGEKVVDATAGETQGLALVTVDLPAEAKFARLHIDTAPSLAAGLIEGLEYLTGFPYGCVEQTMSRFLPDVLVAQTLQQLGLSNPRLEAELPEQVRDGLQRLYRFQHFDGGWGWWESDDTGAFQTAHVVYGLVQAERAGFDVREEVLQRGAQALRTPLVETDNLDLKAYITYVLTEYGEGDIALARSLLGRQAQLSPYSRAYLALTLAQLGDRQSARAIVDDLARQVVETETTAHWTEKKFDWQLMSSDGRTTALVLQAMLAVEPDIPLVPKTVRWLMSRRLGGYWRTTQETAAIIIALTDYLATTGELQAAFNYTVTVNGNPVGEIKVTPENVAQHREFTVTSTSAALSAGLQAGGNEVRIEKSGEGTVYFATDLRYVLPRDAIAADRSTNGPTVRRQYLDPETEKPIESVEVGDLVRVKLTVEVPTDMWYMQIEDPLPAGTEAVNFTLQTTGFRGREPRYLWSRPELRDKKAVFFTTFMWQGTHEYSYLIRATTAGEFRAMPAIATPMYQPEVWGRSDSAVLEVRAGPAVSGRSSSTR